MKAKIISVLVVIVTAATRIATVGSALAAVPTNLQISAGHDVGGGVLHFDMTWQSSSGNLQDLAYSLREPIFVDLQVTNPSAQPTAVDLGGDGKTNLLVTVKQPDGQTRTVRLPSGGLKTSGKHLLGGNESYTEQLVLNEWNQFSEVGDYSVSISLVPALGQKGYVPTIADVHLSIGPRDESALRTLAKTLADQAINGRGVAERRSAALALSYVSDPLAIPDISRVLSRDCDTGTALIAALARFGGSSAAVDALRSAKHSHNAEVSAAAERALRQLLGVPGRHDGKPIPEEVAD